MTCPRCNGRRMPCDLCRGLRFVPGPCRDAEEQARQDIAHAIVTQGLTKTYHRLRDAS